ncbi:hypothetical protein SCHPADRAFT_947736 [Schizopora paradoxa]|uniref:Nephrocystin 3-like N-terminal domain-containing protein n=1 Tax=Schizopora paradoxa TaxID=27342 RepID=A0A0H2RHN5_9AGAM|nr:hypothetical protein SCHPADRAFT_947736 [Schizopora paradoxa]
MSNNSYLDRDLGKHFLIQKELSITIQDASELCDSDKFQVLFEDLDGPVTIQLAKPEKIEGLSCHWSLEREILVFPNDYVTFQVLPGKEHSVRSLMAKMTENKGSGPREYHIKYETIAKELEKRKRRADEKQQNDVTEAGGPTAIAIARGDYVIKLRVEEGSIETIIEMTPNENLDPLLPERLQGIIDSSDTLMKNVQSLQSVLGSIPVTEEAFQLLENTFTALGNAHPLAKAVITALTIPYKLLKNEVGFKQKMKGVAQAMLFACQCLMDIRYHTKITLAKDLFKSTLRLLRNAAVFIDLYCKKNRIRQLIGAQFSKKLEKYAEDLIKQKNDFQMAMILQIARDVHMLTSLTSDDFLRRRLDPVTRRQYDSRCLEGTRTSLLDKVEKWLSNPTSQENILWIVGAPGAGKTTIAATIAYELNKKGRPCAKFFLKRDIADLRDARRIWPSLAYSLADRNTGVKAEVMHALRDKKDGDVQDDTVSAQFQELIKGPLESDLKETFLQLMPEAYPVIIIDGVY